MKKAILICLFALLGMVQGAWAQEIAWTEVGTKEALNTAIADGAHIRLTADIMLSEYLKIGQSNNYVGGGTGEAHSRGFDGWDDDDDGILF